MPFLEIIESFWICLKFSGGRFKSDTEFVIRGYLELLKANLTLSKNISSRSWEKNSQVARIFGVHMQSVLKSQYIVATSSGGISSGFLVKFIDKP